MEDLKKQIKKINKCEIAEILDLDCKKKSLSSNIILKANEINTPRVSDEK